MSVSVPIRGLGFTRSLGEVKPLQPASELVRRLRPVGLLEVDQRLREKKV